MRHSTTTSLASKASTIPEETSRRAFSKQGSQHVALAEGAAQLDRLLENTRRPQVRTLDVLEGGTAMSASCSVGQRDTADCSPTRATEVGTPSSQLSPSGPKPPAREDSPSKRFQRSRLLGAGAEAEAAAPRAPRSEASAAAGRVLQRILGGGAERAAEGAVGSPNFAASSGEQRAELPSAARPGSAKVRLVGKLAVKGLSVEDIADAAELEVQEVEALLGEFC